MLQGILDCEVNCLSSRWCVVPWDERRKKIHGSTVSVEASCVNLAVVGLLATVATADKANFRPLLSQRNRRQTWSRRTTFLFKGPRFSFNTGLFFSSSFIPLLFHVIKTIQLANTNDAPRTNCKWTTPVRLRLNSLYTRVSAEETSVFTSCFSWNCTELLLI